LAEPDYFVKCQGKYLNADYRLNQLLLKLGTEVESNSIICLQEVSTDWASKLHTFFISRNYYFITGLYGKKFDGHMGVGIAVPMSAYDVLDVDIATLSESDSMMRQMPPKQPYVKRAEVPRAIPPPEALDPTAVSGARESLSQTGNDKQWLKKFKEILGISAKAVAVDPAPTPKAEPYQSPYSSRNNYRDQLSGEAIVWSDALKRFNQVVSVRLQSKEAAQGGKKAKTFCVSTYHMPCAFRTPGVMLVHTVLLLKHIQQFLLGRRPSAGDAVEEPSILVGDFNFKPDSLMYNVITNFKYAPAGSTGAPAPGSAVDVAALATTGPGGRNTVCMDQESVVDLFKIGTVRNNDLSNTSEWRDVFNANSGMTRERFDWTLRSTTDCDSVPGCEPSLYSSAYHERNGGEPDFTNYAFTRSNGNPQDFQSAFIDTLDYIFVSSPHWQVESVKALPHRDEFAAVATAELAAISGDSSGADAIVSLPTSNEPSDHLLLSASLILK
jgi:hypothetical protein